MKQLSILSILLAFILIFGTEQSHASHAMGGDFVYECLGTGPNGDTIQITLSFYRDCDGIAAPITASIGITSSCGSYTLILQPLPLAPAPPGGSPGEVSNFCDSVFSQSTCNGGTALPGVIQHLYQGTIVLPPCADWVISYSTCCRNNMITNLVNPSAEDMYIEATLNNLNAPCNSSPQFTSIPVPFICAGIPFSFNHGVYDPDGDSLAYSLINPMTVPVGPIAFNFPNSVIYPLTTVSGTFGFDPSTGQLAFTPDVPQVGVLTILVEEYRNGLLIGSTIRDMQVVVLANSGCSLPPPFPDSVATITGGISIGLLNIEACPGDSVSFFLFFYSPTNDSIAVTSNYNIVTPGAQMNFIQISQDSVFVNYRWVPTPADTGTHYIGFTISVPGACPIVAASSDIVQFEVLPGTYAGPDIRYCPAGGPKQIHVGGGSHFSWLNTTGIVSANTDSSNIWVAPTTDQTYIVQSDLSSTCKNRDTINVAVIPDFTYSISNDTGICMFNYAQLWVDPDPAQAPYFIEWIPSATLNNNNIPNPLAQPLTTTMYTSTMTSDSGCVMSDSILVTVTGIAPNVVPIADPDTVCPGGIAQLDILTSPVICGLSSGQPCAGPVSQNDVGTGTIFTSSTIAYPAVYGGWYDGARHQILYRASELQAAGLSGGMITELGFNVAQINGSPQYCNFEIKVGCTSVNSLTTFQGGLNTVFTAASINVIPGWNSYSLTNFYDWDGVSNIIIEVCFYNALCQPFSNNSQTYYTTTLYTSVVYNRADVTPNICTLNTVFGTSAQRPNTRFWICNQQYSGNIIQWTNGSLLSNPNIVNPIATVNITSSFQVTVDSGGCPGQGSVIVVVDTAVWIDAGSDIFACIGDTVQINPVLTGTPNPIELICGANGTATTQPAMTRTVGNAFATTSTPTPFAGGFHDGRLQLLFRVNELNNINMNEGVISEIAFDVAFKNSTGPFDNYTVKMGCTNLTALTGFESGLTVVYGPNVLSTIVGLNTITLDTPFDWDGVSNLIVEVCFDNNSYVNDDLINYTTTSFSSVAYDRNDFSSGCTLSNAQLNGSRPDVRFTVHNPPPGNFTFTWNPSVNLSDPTVLSPFVSTTSTSNTNYTILVSDGPCAASDQINVIVDSCICNHFVQVVDISCAGANDGEIYVSIVGGTPPFTFNWSNGSNSDTLTGLAQGIYSVTIQDADNCVMFNDITVSEPLPLQVTISGVDATCQVINGGTATVAPNGGTTPYAYSWNTNPAVQPDCHRIGYWNLYGYSNRC